MPISVGKRNFLFLFFFNATATTEIYTLSLHDALPIFIRFDNGARVTKELEYDGLSLSQSVGPVVQAFWGTGDHLEKSVRVRGSSTPL